MEWWSASREVMRCRSVRVRVGKVLDVGGGSGYSIAYRLRFIRWCNRGRNT